MKAGQETGDSLEVLAILLAAGRGSRSGHFENKVFRKLGGQSILERAAACLLGHPVLSGLVVVAPAGEEDRMEGILTSAFAGHSIQVVTGGATRQESALAGLLALKETASRGRGRTLALIHDAARCFLPADLITALVETIGRHRCGAVPVVPVTDTLRLLDGSGELFVETLPRERLAAMQTPQGADLDILLQAARLAEREGVQVTDDMETLLRIGYPVRPVQGDSRNIKITTAEDIRLAEYLCGGSDS